MSAGGERGQLPPRIVAVIAAHRSSPRWRAEIADAFAKLPCKLWDLNIDWPNAINALHIAARVTPLRRTASSEKAAHNKIAANLRKVANLLNVEGQVDSNVAAMIDVARDHLGMVNMPTIAWEGEWRRLRLSELLRAMADLYEGEKIRCGIHGHPEHGVPIPVRSGVDAAAALATSELHAFMLKHTGKAHDTIVEEIVRVYHPAAAERDRLRNARNKIGNPRKK